MPRSMKRRANVLNSVYTAFFPARGEFGRNTHTILRATKRKRLRAQSNIGTDSRKQGYPKVGTRNGKVTQTFLVFKNQRQSNPVTIARKKYVALKENFASWTTV